MTAAKKTPEFDFVIYAEVSGSSATLNIGGVLDESASFDGLDLGAARVIDVHVKGLKLINSIGVRSWIVWLKSQERPGLLRTFVMHDCPRVLVDQINMIQGVLPEGSRIDSFFVPYACSSCDHLQEEHYRAKHDFAPATVEAAEWWVTRHTHCVNCNSEMEIDIIPEKYFRFLKYRPHRPS